MEKMSCWCSALFGVLVIVFAWWITPWNKWILTVLGVLIAIAGISGKCYCKTGIKPKKQEVAK